MIFTSFEYAGFLAATVALLWLLPRRARPALLLVASYAFYATWSLTAISILAGVSLVTWAAGLTIPGAEGTRRKVLAGASLVVAISPLIIFKAVEGFGLAGGRDDLPGLAADLAVPVGLSFFSFQAVSYLVDLYRRELEPTRSLVDVALYLAFFPHLLAGPIVRAKKLIPAFHAIPRRPDRVQWAEAAELILVGTFKKVALADPLLLLTTKGFTDLDTIGTTNMYVSVVLVLVAGYFDVTGYIDIARGSAKLLGIDMQRNSLMPLTRSTGYADFWRRWQLTVMMWFRDYVFRPLRGSGRQPWRDHVALFGTFFALGIWHSFTVGWVLWGIASGIIITAERALQGRRAAKRRLQTLAARKARSRAALPKPPNRWAGLATGLALTLVTFPLISSTSFADPFGPYAPLLRWRGAPTNWDLVLMGVLAIVGLVLLDRREERREAKAGRADPVTLPRALAFGVMVLAVIVYSGPEPQTFVYFAF